MTLKKGHNSTKGDNPDLKNTRVSCCFYAESIYEISKPYLKFVMDGRTDEWTDKPKAICPFNFFKVRGIKKQRHSSENPPPPPPPKKKFKLKVYVPSRFFSFNRRHHEEIKAAMYFARTPCQHEQPYNTNGDNKEILTNHIRN